MTILMITIFDVSVSSIPLLALYISFICVRIWYIFINRRVVRIHLPATTGVLLLTTTWYYLVCLIATIILYKWPIDTIFILMMMALCVLKPDDIIDVFLFWYDYYSHIQCDDDTLCYSLCCYIIDLLYSDTGRHDRRWYHYFVILMLIYYYAFYSITYLLWLFC